jgi:hypothetical protein
MLNRYQISETIFGTLLFLLIYFIYRKYIEPTKYYIFDVLYCTVSLFLILLIKNFTVSYYQLYNLNNI